MTFIFKSLVGGVSAIAMAAAVGSFAEAQELPALAGLSVSYSTGVMNGKAQEFVYDANTGKTVSRLDWRSSNVAMFETAGSLFLKSWLRVGINGATNLSSGGTMDDYDFDLNGCPDSAPGHTLCHSSGPSQLRTAALADAFVAARFFDSGILSLEALAGDRYEYYRWQAIGGTANYNTMPPGNGISYGQTWNAPYLGLGASATSGALTFNGRVTGSVLAKGDDRDNHHLRSLLFKDDFGASSMIGADAQVAYRVNSYLSLTAGYRYQNWMAAKGSTAETNLTNGHTAAYPGDAAGGNNVAHTVSLGVKADLRDARSPEAASLKDGPVYAPTDWRGWYGGVAGGWDWQAANWKTTGLGIPAAAPDAYTGSANLDVTGGHAGLFAGRSWVSGRYLWGIEADFGQSNTSQMRIGIPGTSTAAALSGSSDLVTVGRGWDASVRARVGYLVTPFLQLYGTGGLAIGEVKASASCSTSDAYSWCATDRYETVSKVLTGWTAGAGYEWAFAGNWFTRGEYRYTDLGALNHNFYAGSADEAVSAKIGTVSQQLMFGLGYRF